MKVFSYLQLTLRYTFLVPAVRCVMEPLIHKVCLLTFLVVFDATSSVADLSLIVPPDPVVASAGDDIILPCHLSPQSSAVAMDIRWFKEGEFTNPLYLYKSRTGEEGKGYKGRVSLFTQELERGNISLLLKNVKVSDMGRYKCQASHLDWIQEPAVVLQVTKQGSVPRISMMKHHRVFIQLSCSSENWFPEPHMLWTDSSGKEITSAETERPKQKEGGVLYSITSHMRVGMDQLEGVTCVVMSKDRGTKMESTSLQMTEEFYLSSLPDRVYISAFVIPVFLALVCITASVLFVMHQKRDIQEKLKPINEVKAELKKKNNELTKKDQLFVHVTLDPDTANPKLTLSNDNKSVKFGDLRRERDTGKRFEEKQCVLGMEGYDTGKHYWEVDLGEKTQWSVGVAQDREKRGSNIQMIPENGYWSIRLENGVLKTVEKPLNVLPIELKPVKLGVLVDYEEGKIVFFNVEKRCHIHSFTGTFTKKLYPFFGPLIDCEEELKISPVPQAEK
ncbi:butyrophilin subfamily 1 member A1 isoform X2 [Salvelinus sp. IW2-2015]|uniref:butyrophilin subfamily 1 member A1 isoform X2 n=1 Tax=Salvelinus sp. IW2-2015 TaxID=2691554 RepID=UPI000CDF9C9D|nr:butyrophilin subfamily 1 member A1 isoform X2 [Salvelinus alpinus]